MADDLCCDCTPTFQAHVWSARDRKRIARMAAAALAAIGVLALAACGSSRSTDGGGPQDARQALVAYVGRVEPVRLTVNRLLDQADPILADYRRHRSSPNQSARRFDRLERRFARYTVEIASIQPATAALRRIHRPYAHTCVLEDAYLSALAAGLREGRFDDLPKTQAEQRAAIIEWRTRLAILAARLRVWLPPDIERAGRGEIAPSPQ